MASDNVGTSVLPSPTPSLNLLGDVSLRGPKGIAHLGGKRQLRLLVALVLSSPRPVSKGRLIERIWQDEDLPADPSAALRTYVSRLRLALMTAGVDESSLATASDGYSLNANDWHIDVDRFRELINESASADEDLAVKLIDEAMELLTGPPFGALTDEHWLTADVAAIEEMALSGAERKIQLLSVLGRTHEAIVHAKSLLDHHPWREGLVEGLMLALYRAGQAAEAINLFQDHRTKLADQLGLEPGPSLQQLEHRILVHDPGLSVPEGRQLGAYTLLRPHVEHRHETVWQGEQHALGRLVAIRHIDAGTANEPDFIRSFSRRVKELARLTHDHVVAVHDCWREPTGAWVVSSWVDGTRLDQRNSVSYSDEDLRRFCLQIGGALASAHAQGVYHGAVGHGAIIVDGDFNFYLTDFAITNRALLPEDDVDGLARLIADLVGHIPERRIDTAKAAELLKPSGRQLSSINDVTSLAASILVGEVDPLERTASRVLVEANPYRGLRPFDEADAAVFFGREQAVDELIDHLTNNSLVAVVGASGSGKSSMIRAGLLPRLRAGDPTAGDALADPYVAVMTPGDQPLDRLASALEQVSQHDINNIDPTNTRDRPETVGGALPDGLTLLVIDQFEELFVLNEPHVRNDFLRVLDQLLDLDGPAQVRVLVTIRADFWDQPLNVPGFGTRIAAGTVHLSAMRPEELGRAIVGPAELADCSFEDGLVARLIHEASQPEALPLLQFALTELFERRDGNVLTNAAFDELGGLGGAIAQAAEDIHARLDTSQQQTLRELFGRLAFTDGRTDTRRRVEQADLSGEGLDQILDQLAAARLISFDADPITRAPLIELAHESLLSSWDRLRQWLDQDRRHRQLRQDLDGNARRWLDGGRMPVDLLRGARLDEALELIGEPIDEDTGHTADQTQPTRQTAGGSAGQVEFVAASVSQRDRETSDERRRIRRLRSMLVGSIALLIVASAAGSTALWQRGRAVEASEQASRATVAAETRRMVADVPAATETSPDLGLLVAAAAYRREPGPATLGGLQQAFIRTGPFLGLYGAGQEYLRVEWAPGSAPSPLAGPGTGRVYALHHGGVDVLDVATGDRSVLTEGVVTGGLAVSPDGRVVAVATGMGVELFEPQSGNPVGLLETDGLVRTIAFNDTGTLLATGDRDGNLELWRLDDLARIGGPVAAHPERHHLELPPEVAFPESVRHEPMSMPIGVNTVRFAPDGQTIVTTGGVFVRTFAVSDLHNIDSIALDRPTITGDGRIAASSSDIEFLSDDVVVVAAAQVVQVLNRTTGDVVAEYSPGSEAGSIPDDFNIDLLGDLLVTSLHSGEINLLDVASGEILATMRSRVAARTGEGAHIAIDPVGRRAAVTGEDGVRIVSLDGSGLLHRSVDQPEWARIVQVSDDGRWVMWSAFDQAPLFQRLESEPTEPFHIDVEDQFLGTLSVYGEPTLFQRAGTELTVLHQLDPDTLQPTGDRSEPMSAWGGALSPDGQLLAIGSNSPEPPAIHLLTPESLALSRRLVLDEDRWWGAISVAWTPDSKKLAAVFINGVDTPFAVVFDPTTGQEIGPRITQAGSLRSVRYSPDGRHLLTGDLTGRVIVRDADTLQPTGVELQVGGSGVGAEYGRPFEFSDDGSYLLATVGEPSLIDTATWKGVGGPFQSQTGIRLGAAAAGRYVPTANGEQTLIWDLNPNQWASIACQAAGRDLTRAEWDRYGPEGETYQPACPERSDRKDDSD